MMTATRIPVAIFGRTGRSRAGSRPERLAIAGARSSGPGGSGSISQPAACALAASRPYAANPRCTSAKLAMTIAGKVLQCGMRRGR